MSETHDIDEGSIDRAAVEMCYCLNLRKASRRLIRFYDDHLSAFGLTAGQFALMSMIAAGSGVSVQALADAMDMDQSAASRGLGPLERDGWITSATDEKDGRKRVLFATPDGLERLAAASRAWSEAQADLRAKSAEVDIDALVKQLRSLSVSLS